MCLRINKTNLGTRFFRRCYWFFFRVFEMFSAFFGIFGHISTLAHRILSFLLHRYLLHVHQNQNHQKNLGTRPLRGYYWYYWFSKFYVVLCSFWFHEEQFWLFSPFFAFFFISLSYNRVFCFLLHSKYLHIDVPQNQLKISWD